MRIKRIKNLAFGFTAILLLNGCSLNKTTEEIVVVKEPISASDDHNLINEYKKDITEELKDNLDNYSNNILSYGPTFTEEDINELENKVVDRCNYEVVTDNNELINIIIDNSGETAYSAFETEYREIIMKTLYETFDELEESDLSDYHNYGELKICISSDILDVVCYNPLDNTIKINPYYIQSEDYLTANLRFFLNSVREYPCNCSDEIVRGVNYNDHNTVLNVMAGCKDTDSKELKFSVKYVYENSREIFLLSLLSNTTPEDYYQAVYNNDFKELENVFNIKTDQDKENFYELVFTIDKKVEPSYRINSNLDGTIYTLEPSYNERYKLDLFRMYLENLADYNIKNKLGLEEHLLLFDYGKYVITDDYMAKDIDEYLRFYLDFIEMEKAYKSYISEYYNTSFSEINKKENEILNTYSAINSILYDGESNVNYDEETIEKANYYIKKYPNLKLMLGYSFHTNLRYNSIIQYIEDYYESIGEPLYENNSKRKVLI